MKISVVIPAYNAEHVLTDAVLSVMQQTALQSICEIIIVNDGSHDNTSNVMIALKKQYINRMFINLIEKENGGASSARNAGIKAAKGDWIALLDADDEWLPNKIERQIQTIQEHPEIDFLGTGSDDRELKILHRKIDYLYKANMKDLCIKSFPVTPSILFRKDIIETVGYFDETKKYMEDSDFCLRVCERYNYYYLPESLVRTGHGKKALGEAGLSSNIKGMHLGRLDNMKHLYQRKSISYGFYCFCRLFNFIKYCIRRIQKQMK